MNALTYMFGTYFFSIFMWRKLFTKYLLKNIYKDLTNLKNDAKYKETY